MNKRQKEAEAALHDQENFLPKRQLVLTFLVLSITLLVFFIDQNGIGQILPTVAKDLNAGQTISWAGTASLIGNTTFQVLYGRLSDIFGRKVVYLSAVALLCLGDLGCGLARSGPMLFVFRGLTGIAGGGIQSLGMMIASDIVTLEQRGKYQGILGSMIGLGNLIGPLLSATFAQTHHWRALFYFLCPTAGLCGCIAWYFLPSTIPKGNFKENAKKIDYWGVATASTGLILLLIPISGGGAYFAWNSPMVISMIAIGALFLISFIFVEWKISPLPMMPLHLFKNIPVAALLFQSFFYGIVFYSYLYYLPLYYQNVRRYTPIRSALLTLPMVLPQSVSSIISGQYISRQKRYGGVIWLGFILFTLGVGLTTLFNRTIPVYAIVLILIVLGYGNGHCLQPTIIAVQAHCTKSQRAVVISVRNFLRCLGGSVGLAISAAVLQNVLRNQLPTRLKYLAKNTYIKPNYSQFTAADGEIILSAYAESSRAVFIFMVPCAAISMFAFAFVPDKGLTRPEEQSSKAAPANPANEENLSEREKGPILGPKLDFPQKEAKGKKAEEDKVKLDGGEKDDTSLG